MGNKIRCWHAFSVVNVLCVSFLVLISFLISTGNAETNFTTDSLANCLKPPERFIIECRVLNVKNARCIPATQNVILAPYKPENDNGEINCTSPTPINLSFRGFQLRDFVNATFVRNADNVFNEATYVYSISFPLHQVFSSREIVLSKYSNPEEEMSIYIFRPGKQVFSSNFSPKAGENAISLEYTEKNLVIPCISNDPNVKPVLEPISVSQSQAATLHTVTSFDSIKGFILKTQPFNPVGRYACKAVNKENNVEEQVLFDVLPAKESIFQPQEDKVYLFPNSELHISCRHQKVVTLEGNFKNKSVSGLLKVSPSSLPQFQYEIELTEKLVKVGDSGKIECKTSDDKKILKTWDIQTLDIHDNKILQLKKENENLVSCGSSAFNNDNVKLQAVFCQGVTECKLSEFCFDEKNTSKTCKSIQGQPCKGSSGHIANNSLCLSMPHNDSSLSQGMIKCSVGNYSYQTNYFRGFDQNLYLDWQDAPLPALIDIFVPNVTMYPHNSYPFGCRAVKFISDGRLQWVIRGKDGSEILLHKNRVQDLYGVYVTSDDYKMYTVRESNIRLIYPNDYDVICMVPRWNATAWVRHHKRINVAAKEAPVAAIVSVSAVLILALSGVVIYVLWRLKKAKEAIRNLTEKEVQEFLDGNPDALKNSSEKEAHEVVDSLPYDKNFEIPRDKLLIDTGNCLGKGAFGTVLKGRVDGVSDVVAVKTVNSDCEVSRFKGFLSELKIMIYIGKHPYIVSLIGASTEKIKEKTLYIIVEYCANGSMESYLRKYKGCFLDQIINNEIKPGVASYENFAGSPNSTQGMFTTVDLVRWSYQIANGMDYLASKKVIHADLAARNILITTKGNAKITDFGLSRQLFDYTQYVKKQQEPLPWRWMAIESLQHLRFSTQSDVWAYGVLLWEIFSLGDMPYPGLAWDIHFVQELLNGLRLIKPLHTTDAIFNNMLDCWQENPDRRPKFSFLAQYFKSLLEILNAALDTTGDHSVGLEAYSNPLVPGYTRVIDVPFTEQLLVVDPQNIRKSTNTNTNVYFNC